MAIKIRRKATQDGKATLRDPEVTLQWAIRSTGADKFNEIAIEAAFVLAVPSSYAGLAFVEYQITELGNGNWNGTSLYKLREGAPIPARSGPPGTQEPAEAAPGDDEPLDESYSFKSGGGTKHIIQSLETVSKTRRGVGFAPDFKGLIGVNKDKVEGCDIYHPELTVSMVKEIPSVSTATIRHWAYQTATVNDDEFYHFDSGEVLFLGASGQTKGPEAMGGWTVTFEFAISPNEEDIEIIPASTGELGLTVEEKRGHDYLWVYYEPDKSENKLVQRPLAAYVERVYRYTDFADLGIGE